MGAKLSLRPISLMSSTFSDENNLAFRWEWKRLLRGIHIQTVGQFVVGCFNNLVTSFIVCLCVGRNCIMCFSSHFKQSRFCVQDFWCCHVRSRCTLFSEHGIASEVVFDNVTASFGVGSSNTPVQPPFQIIGHQSPSRRKKSSDAVLW